MENAFGRFQCRAGSADDCAPYDRVATAVDGLELELMSACHLPRHLIAIGRLCCPDRRPTTPLTYCNRHAAILQFGTRGCPRRIEEIVISDLNQAGRAERVGIGLDNRDDWSGLDLELELLRGGLIPRGVSHYEHK